MACWQFCGAQVALRSEKGSADRRHRANAGGRANPPCLSACCCPKDCPPHPRSRSPMGYPVTSLVEMWEGRWTGDAGRRVACSGLRAGVRVRLHAGGHVERLHHRLRCGVGKQPGLRRQDRVLPADEPGLRRRCRAAGGAPPPRVALGPLGRHAARPNRRRRRRSGRRLCRGFGGGLRTRPGAGGGDSRLRAVRRGHAGTHAVVVRGVFGGARPSLRPALPFVRLPGPGRRVLRPLVPRRVGVVRRVLRAARRLACADAACAPGCRGTPRRRVPSRWAPAAASSPFRVACRSARSCALSRARFSASSP